MKKLLFMLTIMLAVCSCTPAEQNRSVNKSQQTYTYTVIDKSKDVESHYSFLLDRIIVETVSKLVVKDSWGNICTIKDKKMYYKYNVGESFKSTRRY